VLPPEEYERREVDDEFDTDDYVVEPTYTTEVPVMSDLYVDPEEAGEDAPERGTLPARTGSARADLPEGGRDESR
jgi:hypothetical protein